MILVLVVIIVAMCVGLIGSIWEYITIFLFFMAAFCHLAAVLLARTSAAASRKLDVVAMVFAVLAIVALIVVFILNWCDFY